MAIDIIARGMIESSNGNISQLSEKVSNHTDNSDIHVTVSDKENWNSHPNDVQASGNPVQMDGLQGGVPFSEITVSGKNLIPYPYYDGSSKTINGVTFTVNDDGSITANGTATAISTFKLAINFGFAKEGDYFLSGCPSGGGLNTFYINWYQNHTGVVQKNYNDYGSGNKIPYQHIFSENNTLAIAIISGTVCDNLIFRPQIELGTEATAYEPPITGRDLTVGVCGKNLLPAMSNSVTRNGITYTVNADGTITLNGTAEKADGVDVVYKMPLKAGVYTLSGCPEGGGGTSFALRAGLGTANTLYGRDYGNGLKITVDTDTVLSVTIQNAEIGRVFDNLIFRPQLELGSTATPYEPYNGSTTTITPDTNPYVIPNDIRQVDGLNVVSVSEGELSVVGVRKNAAIKRIWDDMGMDLLFDGVTSADNPAVVNLANYNMIRIDVSGNYAGTTYFNCGSTYLSKSTLDFAFESYGCVAIPASAQAIIINISKSGAEYSLSFSGFNEKQLVDVIKIYGIK